MIGRVKERFIAMRRGVLSGIDGAGEEAIFGVVIQIVILIAMANSCNPYKWWTRRC